MFDPSTLRQIAESEGVPLADVERIAGDVDRKPDVSNPNALLVSWVRNERRRRESAPRSATTSAPATPAYFGWDHTGTLIRSLVPVTNPPTEYAAWIVREIRDALLTPADVAGMVNAKGGRVLEAFSAFGSTALEDWSRRDTIHGWATAQAQSSLHETVRSWGNWRPWATDPNAWQRIVATCKAREQRSAA